MGQQKSPAFSRIKDATDMKEIFYLQPKLFVEDTENFLISMRDQIQNLNEKQGRATPTQKKHKTELDYAKEKQIYDLEDSNQDVMMKMGQLMELTKQITQKMKQETINQTSPRFRLAKGAPNDQLHELDQQIHQNYEEIKSLKQEKHNLVMKFEVNQKDHSRYVEVKNEIVDTERKRKELEKYHGQLVKMIEGTRDLIQKNTEDSGKEQKVLDVREMIMMVKAQAKELE